MLQPCFQVGNVYVNLDRTLPLRLNLKLGENLIFIRDFGSAGSLLHSLEMPASHFTAAAVPYGSQIPGQPEFTYALALGLAKSEGEGEIAMRFESSSGCVQNSRLVCLRFSIRA